MVQAQILLAIVGSLIIIVVGENLARAEVPGSEVVDLWLASPGHCANVMHPGHVEMGAAGRDGYWTQVFGRPM